MGEMQSLPSKSDPIRSFRSAGAVHRRPEAAPEHVRWIPEQMMIAGLARLSLGLRWRDQEYPDNDTDQDSKYANISVCHVPLLDWM